MRKLIAVAGSTVHFLMAPCMVAGLVPWWLTDWAVRQPPFWAPLRVVGLALLVAATFAVAYAYVQFVAEGTGTPAPVVPTERLVVGGLYRYVRNPMYLAVITAIVGQVLLLGRPVLLLYAATAGGLMGAFATWYEVPTLRRQFGAQYAAYRRAVPAWWPRLRPWNAEQSEPS
jgi:protein-S-isoprenylcysteine O-methyltransferase Ste14